MVPTDANELHLYILLFLILYSAFDFYGYPFGKLTAIPQIYHGRYGRIDTGRQTTPWNPLHRLPRPEKAKCFFVPVALG